MPQTDYRIRIVEYIREQARPVDKFSHQPRLYELARQLAGQASYDDDVLFAAAWLHDIGVFIGHRPEDPTRLSRWDSVGYAVRTVPGLLRDFGFPTAKIPMVAEVIRTHLPEGEPTCFEAQLLRDADILEQLGCVGILRAVSKVGRDTRYACHADAVAVLRRAVSLLPEQLTLPAARQLAVGRVERLRAFLTGVELEALGLPF